PHLPPTIGAFGQCSVSFTAAPGTMVFTVWAVGGTWGNVVIDASGPLGGRVVIDCPLHGNGASCVYAVDRAFAGAWTATARAQVGFAANDPWVRMEVTYP
ncbi:MAG TPA: hypothetical protein VM582_08165, partial [Candidatus Thermoplasmatota archaeon]|nr:hypothetical protein [Candidatus Thermoplasmatota archaeon]